MTTLLAPIRPALPSFTVTGDELRVLVATARSTVPTEPSVVGDESSVLDGLVARGLLGRGPSGEVVLPDGPVGGVIEVVGASHVQLHVRHLGAPGASSWFALTPVVGVELHENADGSWAVAAFATREVLLRVAELVGLEDRDPPAVEPFETTGAALEQCADHLALGRRLAAEDELRAAGAGELSARAFLGALERRLATNAVVGSQPTDDRVPRVFAWLDSDDWGLWRVPLPETSGVERVLIGSLTAFAVCAALTRFLPVGDDPGWRDVVVPFAAPA